MFTWNLGRLLNTGILCAICSLVPAAPARVAGNYEVFNPLSFDNYLLDYGSTRSSHRWDRDEAFIFVPIFVRVEHDF